MAKQIYIDENGNENLVSGTINYGSLLPMSPNDSSSMVADRIEALETRNNIKYYTTSNYKLNDLTWVATGGGIYRAIITLSSLPANSKILGITIYNFLAIGTNYNFMPYINVDADRQMGIMSNLNSFGSDSALGFRVLYI